MLVNGVFAERGNIGIDELIGTPPSEEVLISPWLYDTNQVDIEVAVQVPSGSELLEPTQQLSMLDLLVMLDAWLPWEQARGALDGWAGGGYTSYEKGGGPVCFSAIASFDQPPEAFTAAITAWAVAAGSATVPLLSGNQASFEACARGSGSPTPPEPLISPIEAVVLEHVVVAEAGPDPSPELVRQYQCVARRLIDDPSTAPLMLDAELSPDEAAIFTWVTTASAGECAGIAAQ